MQALTLNHAAFESADLERQVAYYEEIIGLQAVERSGARVYLASRSGTDALVLSAGSETALTGFALQIGAADPDEVLASLAASGISAERRSSPHPGVAESVCFADPDGFQVELLSTPRLHAPGPARGVAPLRLGHLALVVRDVNRTARFYADAFGFREGDRIGDHFVFLRCGHEHHTLNFVQTGGPSRMQHIAFEMQNSAALNASCDVLAGAGLRLVWGPVRHGPGHNIATYHLNGGGQVIELYTEMDLMTNEALGYYDPRPWHTDRPQRPKTWPVGVTDRDIWGPAGPEDFLKLGR